MADYEVKDLEVLSPQAHCRLRKGMYIGDATNPSPLFNEIFDNAIDESQAEFSEGFRYGRTVNKRKKVSNEL